MKTDDFIAHIPEHWPAGVPLPDKVILPDEWWACGFLWKHGTLTPEQRVEMRRYLEEQYPYHNWSFE